MIAFRSPIRWSLVALLLSWLAHATAAPGTFSSGFEGACARDCPPPVDYCAWLVDDPLVQPPGRIGRIVPWSNAFFSAPFYTPTSYLHPIGSITTGGLPQPGRWLALSFKAGAAARYRLDWVEAQSLAFPIRYNGRPARSAFVTVSPCPGDFRTESDVGGDGFLKRGCRRSGNIDTIRFRTDIPNSTTSNCALVAGKAYYLNIGFFEPGETNPQAHTCITGTRCEINVQPQ